MRIFLDNKGVSTLWSQFKAKLAVHANNSDIHVAAEEKAAWDGKAELSDIPTTLPANGGNADTIDGKHAAEFAPYHSYAPIYTGDILDIPEMGTYSCAADGCTNLPSEIASWCYVTAFAFRDAGYKRFICVALNDVAVYPNVIWLASENNKTSDGKLIWSKANDGGNADTLDGKHANGFIKVNSNGSYDCNTLYDTGLYLCGASTTNTPNGLIYGTLLVMPYRKPYGNDTIDFCAQIFIPNGDVEDTSLWYRTSLVDSWNEWTRSCDGGNADTLDGKHAEDFKILTFVDNDAIVTCIEARQDNTVIRLQIQTNMEIARFFKSTDGGASWTEMPLGAATNVGIYTEAKLAALEARIAALEGGTT